MSGELQGREAEVLTVTRDTTEADLKQRRELSRLGTGKIPNQDGTHLCWFGEDK